MPKNMLRRWPGVKLVFTLFFLFALTYAFYHPLVRNMARGLEHLGDPALTAWILNWDLHALCTRPLDIWQANMFHPCENTLAFSENLIAPSILLLPFHAFTKNPILLYNISLFTGIVLSGLCAYLLAYYLARSYWLSLVPAIAFSFSPFMLAHSSHLQMQHACWIPLLILSLLRYFEKLHNEEPGRRLWLLGAALCLLLQFLSNAYYFVFLATSAALLQGLKLLNSQNRRRKIAFVETFCFWLVSALIILPFAWPYLVVHRALGFERGLEEIKYFSADIMDYLAYNASNIWFGKLTGGWADWRVERYLTPGILLFTLAFGPLFCRSIKKLRGIKIWWARYKRQCHWFHIIDVLVVLAVAMLLYILTGNDVHITHNGEVVELIGVKLKMTRPGNTVYYLLVLIALRSILKWRQVGLPRINFSSNRLFFAVLAISAFLMSLGPSIDLDGRYIVDGPYRFFYRFVPGYAGLRVPARFGLLVVLGLSLWGVLNVKGLLAKIASRRLRFCIAAALPLLLAIEFYSHPPTVNYRPQERAVDQWLREAPPGNVVELPLPAYPRDFTRDIRAVFHSVWHWKPIFNGYSGYSPPSYHVIAYYMQSFPSELSVRILNRLGIDYVVVHNCGDEQREKILERLDLLAEFGRTAVFTPRKTDWEIGDMEYGGKQQNLDSSLWRIANTNPEGKGNRSAMNDDDMDTSWHTPGPQAKGDSVLIEFDEPTMISGVELYTGTRTVRFPRGLELQARSRSGNWKNLDYRYDPLQFIDSILRFPAKACMRFTFPQTEARELRIVLTKASRGNSFGFQEIEIYSKEETENGKSKHSNASL